MPVYAWSVLVPADDDTIPPFPGIYRANNTTIESILGGLAPTGTNTVESAQCQVINNDVYFDCYNCHYDGTDWQRTDTAQAAWATWYKNDGSGNVSVNLVFAAAGSNPIGSSWPNVVPLRTAAGASPLDVFSIDSTRVVYSAETGMVTIQTLSGTKQAAGTTLVVRGWVSLYNTTLPADAEVWSVTLGATTVYGMAGSNDYRGITLAFSVPFTGVAAGAVGPVVQIGRSDATAWTTIVNPISSDASGLPSQASSVYEILEV